MGDEDSPDPLAMLFQVGDVGEHKVDRRGDLDVLFRSVDVEESCTGDVSQHECAVVCCLRADRRVRIGGAQRPDEKALRRLAAPIDAPIRDVRDAVSIDDDEGVRCRDGGVDGVGTSVDERCDDALHDLAR